MQIDPAISPFEVDVLRKLDQLFRSALYEKSEPKKQSLSDSLAALKAAHDEAKQNNGR